MALDTTWITRMFPDVKMEVGSSCNEFYFSNAADFVSCLSLLPIHQQPSSKRWKDAANNGWLFRGHWDATWGLVPTAHRIGKPFEKFGITAANQKVGSAIDWVSMMRAEIEALERFHTLANSSSLPCDFSPVIYDEKAGLLTEYEKGHWHEKMEFWPKSAWYPVLAKAQHHGIPTRLLDFSRDGLRAAYFACEELRRGPQDSKGENGKLCVWAFNEADFNDLTREPDQEKKSSNWLIMPAVSQHGSNLASQRGSLILFEGANNYYVNNRHWPDFFEYENSFVRLANGARKKRFIKLTLDRVNAKDVLRLLARYDVTPVTVFPSLDNVSETLKYAHWLNS